MSHVPPVSVVSATFETAPRQSNVPDCSRSVPRLVKEQNDVVVPVPPVLLIRPPAWFSISPEEPKVKSAC